MRLLVTGHRGYVGSVLLPKLQAAGHEITGLDSCLFERTELRSERLPVEERRLDIRDVEIDDLRGFDAVVHLAALSNDPLGDLSPGVTEAINHAATTRLARCAKAAGVHRFVFSSSCSVYGAAGEDWLDEGSACHPVTAYAHSKLAAEVDLAALADRDFSPVSLRHATAYGASAQLRFDLALNNLVAWAVATGRIFIKSDGRAWRPFVHVEDMAAAFVAVLAADREATHNRVLNVGSTGENFRVTELAERVANEVSEARVEFASDAGRDVRCYRVNCDEIRRRLPGFASRWTIDAGIREVAAECRAAGWRPEEFEGPRYARVEHLKELIREGVLSADLRWVGGHGRG